jgi:hypothetical protein
VQGRHWRPLAKRLAGGCEPDHAAGPRPDGPQPFKMAVRYVCEIPDDDPKLESARDTWKRLRVPNRSIRVLDPRGQSKWWYFYRGMIPPEWFAVELRSQSGYVRPTPDELANVCTAIGAEREKHTFEADPAQPNFVYMVPNEPGYHSHSSWRRAFRPIDLGSSAAALSPRWEPEFCRNSTACPRGCPIIANPRNELTSFACTARVADNGSAGPGRLGHERGDLSQ